MPELTLDQLYPPAKATAPTRPDEANLMSVESSGNQQAVSPKGARGLYQVMPATERDPGYGITPAKNSSVEEANRVGRAYYNEMLKLHHGDVGLAVASHNWGPGNVGKWLKNGAKWGDLPKETQNELIKIAKKEDHIVASVDPKSGDTVSYVDAGQGAAPSKGKELTIEQLYGPSTGDENLSAKGKGEPVTSDLKTLGEDANFEARSLASNFATLGDMFLNTPTSIAALAGNVGARIYGMAEGESPQQQAARGKALQDKIEATAPNVFAHLMRLWPAPEGTPQGAPSQLANITNKLMNLTDEGAQRISAATDGLVSADDVNFLRDVTLTALGTRAFTYGAGKIGEKAPAEEVVKNPPKATGQLAKMQAKENLSAAKPRRVLAGAPPITDIPAVISHYRSFPEGPEREAVSRQMRDEAEKTVPEGPDRIRFYKQLADEYARQEARLDEAKANLRGRMAVDEPTPELGGTKRTWVPYALVGLGAVAGTYLDPKDPLEGALLGAIGASAVYTGVPKKWLEGVRKLSAKNEGERINEQVNDYLTVLKRMYRAQWQQKEYLLRNIPNPSDRAVIFKAIDEGHINTLTGKAHEAALRLQRFYADTLGQAQDAGVIKDGVDNYITHIWKQNANTKSILDRILAGKQGIGASAKSRFSLERSYVTLAEGKAAGLVPVSEDPVVLVGLYANSIGRAIATANLLSHVKELKGANEAPLAVKLGNNPGGYARIDAPAARGWLFHPDIVPSLRSLLESQSPGAISTAAQGLNTALKRNVVSFSLFHAKSLFDASLGAVAHPGVSVKIIAQAAVPRVLGTNRFIKQLYEGGVGDIPDAFLKAGGELSYLDSSPVVEDVSSGYYESMDRLSAMLDRTIPHMGAPVRAARYVNQAVDNFTWARLHTAFKMEVFAAKREALMSNAAKAGVKLTQDSADRIAAQYTNDVFGGQNWKGLAETVNNKYLRSLATEVFSPRGRRAMQILMFAPDWTLSTSMSLARAFGKGSGLRGLLNPKTAADLYRTQFIKSAIYYFALSNLINYHNTGHFIWQNKNPLRTDLGDGRSMQLSKHFTEPLEWFISPGQQALNKLGFLPKEAIDQWMGLRYLTSNGDPPPMVSGRKPTISDRIAHAFGSMSPISLGQNGGGYSSAISSALGTPIYGKTPAQRAKDNRDHAIAEALARYKQLHGAQ